jgi:hypothetical protein
MIKFAKPLAVLSVAGAMALVAATPSEARSRGAAIGAGIAGFAIGTAVGAAAASNRYYYNEPYAYYGEPAYVDSYAYAPRRSYYYGGDPSLYYPRNYYSYPRSWRTNGPYREDQLTGSGAGFID